MTFTLDTSGVVVSRKHPSRVWSWADLDAFTQGYVEAQARDHFERLRSPPAWSIDDALRIVRFENLAPETLAAILKDCERRRPGENSREAGAAFWRERQRGAYRTFPPLTAYLGDDGKVYLREA